MTRYRPGTPGTLPIFQRSAGAWAGRYVDMTGVRELVAGCASPQAVEQAVPDAGLQPARIEVQHTLSFEYEQRMLDKANRDIAAANQPIQDQMRRVVELACDRHDTGPAETLVVVFKETLQAMVEHRQLIIEQIERLNQRDRHDDNRADDA